MRVVRQGWQRVLPGLFLCVVSYRLVSCRGQGFQVFGAGGVCVEAGYGWGKTCTVVIWCQVAGVDVLEDKRDKTRSRTPRGKQGN